MNFRQFSLSIFMFFTAAIGLAESYSLLGSVLQPPWLAAVVINSLLALIVFMKRDFFLSLYQARPELPKGLDKYWLAFLPAIAVLMVCVAAVVIGRITGEAQTVSSLPYRHIAFVLWIPIVEEVVFRLGFGQVFRHWCARWVGSYLSVLFFSFMHSYPNLDRVLNLEVGLFWGALILAIACEALWLAYRRLAPIICLHAVCNFSVVLFSFGDKRWLEWLSFLYM